MINALSAAPNLAIALDYDGTVTPIKPTPEEAKPSEKTMRVLRRLKNAPGTYFLLLTGRSPSDLAGLLREPEIEIIGNHGLSRLAGGVTHVHPDAQPFMKNRSLFVQRIGIIAQKYPCVKLEDKGAGLAVHYRSCAGRFHDTIRRAVLSRCRELEALVPVTVTEGKKVVELRPKSGVTKGTAVREWLAKLKSAVNSADFSFLYAGDDITDEDVFSLVEPNWTTIQVGDPGSRRCAARYLAKDQNQLLDFLSELVDARTAGGN